MIGSIVDENTPGLWIDGNTVDVIHISRPRLIGRITLFSPVKKKLAVFVEFRNTGAVVSIRHEHGAVREPRQERRTIEMCAVGTGHLRGADGLYELFAV